MLRNALAPRPDSANNAVSILRSRSAVRSPSLSPLQWIARHPRRTLALSLAVTVAAAWPASRLRVDPDLTAVLPAGAPASEAYRTFLDTFGGFEKVFVVVRSTAPTGDAGEADHEPLPEVAEAAEVMAAELAASPEVAAARAGLTEEDERFFFEHVVPRTPLLLADDDWRARVAPRLEPEAIRARVAQMRQALRGPGGGVAAPLFAADPLGFSEEGLVAAAGSSLPLDPLTGAFMAPDGRAALVVVTPARAELDPAGGRALLAAIDAAAARAREELRVDARVDADTPFEVLSVGGPVYAAHDERILRDDLVRTVTGSAVGVALVLLLGFEGFFVPFAIVAAVGAGLVWTAAIVAATLGDLTVIGVGFAAALLGMGVEYGVHGAARFRQEVMAGKTARHALLGAFHVAGPGIASSALTSAAALAALAVARVRPLAELGQVLTLGVLTTLVATATVGAGLLGASRHATRGRRSSAVWRRVGAPLVGRVVGFAVARPRAVLAGALALTAAAAWGLPRLALDPDLRALRPADHPTAAAERVLAGTFGLGLDTSTVVVERSTLPDALAAAERVRAAAVTALGPGVEVVSPSTWLGAGVAERLAGLRELPFERAAADLEGEIAAAGFRPEAFAPGLAALRSLGRGEDPGAPDPASWPDWLREIVRTDPHGGAAVAVHVRLPIGGLSEARREALAAAVAAAAPGAGLASAPRVGAELRELAIGDLRRSAGIAALLVGAVVLGSFRGDLRRAALAALPLALGCLWTFGFWGAAGRPIDLLSIAALPVLFGTGIDLGVHALHGERLHPGGVAGAVEEAGLPMTLTMLTTGIGFGALGGSRIPSLQNAGLIVALGAVLCLAATFLVLPAIEALRPRRPALEVSASLGSSPRARRADERRPEPGRSPR